VARTLQVLGAPLVDDTRARYLTAMNPAPSENAPAAARSTTRRVLFGLLLGGVAVAGLTAALACSSSQLLAVGQVPAGPLSAPDQDGTTRSLDGERGRPVVVFFYPADGTPGCTKEACAFRDAWKSYTEAGIMVFGVSGDTQESKAAFAEKEQLPFPILADPDHAWAKAFGVGSTLGMMDRVTFLLDREGKVAKVYPDVDPGVHATQVLDDAKALGLVK
jgi:peroxiredoxin Q/BCP